MTNRIPTLDGWRGIAILIVLIAHTQCGLWGHPYHGWRWMDCGLHGVTIFFVLSGYLITTRLLAEGRINLGRFYIRRFFRLMPTAWLYLFVIGVIAHITHMQLIGNDLWGCLFFFRNYYPATETSSNALTSHFWSLSLEEQYYFFWPLLLAFGGRRKAAYGAIALMIICVLLQIWHVTIFDFRMAALMVGCLLAMMVHLQSFRQWIRKYHRHIYALATPLLILHFYEFQRPLPISEAILIAVLIATTSIAEDSQPSRILQCSTLTILGITSYSLYIWQELFLLPHWGLIGIATLPFASIINYILIERPCNAFGHRLTSHRSHYYPIHPVAPADEVVEPASSAV
jgi:peptidoglycan/LPS O-acetylase OafA/YrhL